MKINQSKEDEMKIKEKKKKKKNKKEANVDVLYFNDILNLIIKKTIHYIFILII